MKKYKRVTDHEFKRMEQWLNVYLSDKQREADRRRHLEFIEKYERLKERQLETLKSLRRDKDNENSEQDNSETT